MARSLRVNPDYIERTKLALKRSGLASQRSLAADLQLALSTVSRFFTGKPVDYATFVDVCDRLNLDWQTCAAIELPDPDLTPQPEASNPTTIRNWGHAVDITGFWGRDAELAILWRWVIDDRCRLVTLLGMGGMGKTVLSIKFAQQMQSQFETIIWRSLRNAPPILDLLSDLIGVLSHQQDRAMPTTIDQGITQLMGYLRQGRCLLVLDNGEALLQSGDRSGRYLPGHEGYGQLLRAVGESDHNSCLVLTTREQPRSFTAKQGDNLPIRSLKLEGLSLNDCQQLFATKGTFTGSSTAWNHLVALYAGNPLALIIVAAFISEFFGGDIAQFLTFVGQSPFIFDDIQDLLNQQIQRLSALELTVMYWLAINREPTPLTELQRDVLTPTSMGELLQVLAALQNRCLVERNSDGFTQQPVVMEYITHRLIQAVSDELLQQRPNLCRCHALIKAQTPDYVREIQIRLILQPILENLRAHLGTPAQIETHLQQLLSPMQGRLPQDTGYVAGNTINLLTHLGVDLSGYDLSQLTIWQADLQNLTLHDINFADSDLSRSRFTQTFGGILAVAVSPDGSHLLAGDTNGEVLIWQLANGQRVSTLTGHTSVVWSVAFSPNGSHIASGSLDCTVRLWYLDHQSCLQVLQGHTDVVWAVAFAPDGQRLASSSADGTVRVWDVESGECLQTLSDEGNSVRAVSFSPDGTILATGGTTQTITLWDAQTGQALVNLTGHRDAISALTFAGDGTLLASSSDDHSIKLWDWAHRRCQRTLSDSDSAMWSCAFSPDDQTLVGSGQDGRVWLWHVPSGRCLQQLIGHTNIVHDVAFSPDGTTIISGSLDGTLKTWRSQDGCCLTTFSGHTNTVWSLAYSPDGNTLISGSQDGVARLWHPDTPSPVAEFQHQEAVLSVAVSPNGQVLATGSSDIANPLKLWDLNQHQLWQSLPTSGYVVRAVAFGSEGKVLVSGGDDQTAKLWNVSDATCIRTLKSHTNSVWCVACSPDGTLIATGGFDCSVRLWSIHNDQCVHCLAGNQGEIIAVAFSPLGDWIAGSGVESITRLWGTRDGNCSLTLSGHTSFTSALTFIPNSSLLATGSSDQTIRLWDSRSGECVKVLQGHTRAIFSLAASPDGQILASGGDDETIKLWDVNTGDCLKTLYLPKPYAGMNISGVRGISAVQVATLKTLGAVESDRH